MALASRICPEGGQRGSDKGRWQVRPEAPRVQGPASGPCLRHEASPSANQSNPSQVKSPLAAAKIATFCRHCLGTMSCVAPSTPIICRDFKVVICSVGASRINWCINVPAILYVSTRDLGSPTRTAQYFGTNTSVIQTRTAQYFGTSTSVFRTRTAQYFGTP